MTVQLNRPWKWLGSLGHQWQTEFPIVWWPGSLYIFRLCWEKNVLFICYHKGEWKSRWEKKSLLFSNKLLTTVGQPVFRKRRRKQRPFSLSSQWIKQETEGLESNTSRLPCHTVPGHFLFIAGGSHDPLEKKKQQKLGVFIMLSQGNILFKTRTSESGRLELRHSPRWRPAKKPGGAERRPQTHRAPRILQWDYCGY